MVTPASMSRLTPVNIQVESRPGVRLGNTSYAQKSNGVQDSFSDYLKAQITDVNQTQVALDKADVSFRMLMKVRNKAVEAYQEIMRMSI